MANITAADVKALRDRTGAGMMDSKKALEEAGGDADKAIEILRIKGAAKAQKRDAGRTTSAGLVGARVEDGVGTLVEINSETDFVAKSQPFLALAERVVDQAAKIGAADAQTLLDSEIEPGKTVRDLLAEANAAIGEKIEVRRVARLQAPHVASYLHRTSPDLPPQIGVLLATDAGDAADRGVAKDVAMHIAAMSPMYLTRNDVPADVVASERRIAEETAREEGKPEQALPRIVEGRVNGFFKDNVLLEQPFAKESKKTVQQVLQEAGVHTTGFARFKVGA
jgi:elongation factor Ts